jgi:hypothetical protein
MKDHYFWLKRRGGLNELADDADLHPLIDRRALKRLTTRFDRALMRRLANPIRVVSSTGFREVRLLGLTTFKVRPGTLPELIGTSHPVVTDLGNGRVILEEDHHHPVGSLYRQADLAHLASVVADLWQTEVTRIVAKVPDEVRSWAGSSIRDHLARRGRTLLSGLVREKVLGRHLTNRLGLDPRALALGYAISTPSNGCGSDDYARACEHFRWLARLQEDAPELLWLARMLPLHLEAFAQGEPVADIRKFLVTAGLEPKGWRMILRDSKGNRRLAGFPCYGDPEYAMKQFVAWVNALTGAGLKDPLPVTFFDHFRAAGCDINESPLCENAATRPIDPQVFRMLLAWAKAAFDDGGLDGWLDRDWPLFLDWHQDRPEVAPDRNQARAGWRWLARTMGAWRDAVSRGQINSPHIWTFPAPHVTDGTLEAVALDSRRALWDEGERMSHCVGNYGDRAGSGFARYYSVRRVSDGKRLVTLEIARDQGHAGWAVCCCHGPCNRPPPDEMRPFLIQVANENNRADGLPDFAYPDKAGAGEHAAANDGFFARLFGDRLDDEREAA